MKILIATPAFGAVVDTVYHHSVLAMIQHFHRVDPSITFVTQIISISMISTARNIYASMVLADPVHYAPALYRRGHGLPTQLDRADAALRQTLDRRDLPAP